jgi:UDP-2,3-diacylglucosamine pyrophosphatase LpxH
MRFIRSSRENTAVVRDTQYQAEITAKFDQSLHGLRQKNEALTVDFATARYIIFSDLHRGVRNGADDHRHCERSYNAALAYYYALGYTLIILGDAEELWEESASAIFSTYAHSLKLEARFHQEGRYIRIWGNHDQDWGVELMVRTLLDPIYGGEPLNVRETLLLQLRDGETAVGDLFLAHGHQGTLDSDRLGWLSRWLVQKFWRPIQNLFRITVNTVAEDWQLRAKHDVAMYRWAENQPKLALVAGHTHRPVFKSKSYAAKIEAQLEAKNAQLANEPDNAVLRKEVAHLMAELEWVRAQQPNMASGPEGKVVEMTKPCYFNTGCCCFPDGDITGIEIADGMMRLVRFPDDAERPRPRLLEETSIKDIFADIP